MKIIRIVHEWLADHVKSIQYPNVRQVQRSEFAWVYKMPLSHRFGIAMISFFSILALATLLAFFSIIAGVFLLSI